MEWKDYFFFTRRERRGTLVLMVLIVLLSVVKYGTSYAVSKDEVKRALLAQEIVHFDSLRLAESKSKKPSAIKRQQKSTSVRQPSALPLSKKIKRPKQVHYAYVPKDDNVIIELNSADTTALKQLRGIGSVYARRIVKFRSYLGGYASIDQLKEVYGLPLETFDKIKGNLKVDTTAIVQLSLNELDVDGLKRHPYIRYYQARIIYDLRMRAKDKRLNSFVEIANNRELTSTLKRKIRPYLSFD